MTVFKCTFAISNRCVRLSGSARAWSAEGALIDTHGAANPPEDEGPTQGVNSAHRSYSCFYAERECRQMLSAALRRKSNGAWLLPGPVLTNRMDAERLALA